MFLFRLNLDDAMSVASSLLELSAKRLDQTRFTDSLRSIHMSETTDVDQSMHII